MRLLILSLFADEETDSHEKHSNKQTQDLNPELAAQEFTFFLQTLIICIGL
jgi:hypothetical protein